MTVHRNYINYIASEKKVLKKFRKSALKSGSALVDNVMLFFLRKKSNSYFSLIILISAKMMAGKPSRTTYLAALLTDLLYTATQIHKDVRDKPKQDSGRFPGSKWKSKLYVLIGDLFLAKGLLFAVSNKEYKILYEAAEVIKKINEGEFLRLCYERKYIVNEQELYEIVDKLFLPILLYCLNTGIKSVDKETSINNSLFDFSKYLAYAMYINENVKSLKRLNCLHYFNSQHTFVKASLPLVYSLEKCDHEERPSILKILSQELPTFNELHRIKRFIVHQRGLAYAEIKVKEYRNLALAELSIINNHNIRKTLQGLTEYLIS